MTAFAGVYEVCRCLCARDLFSLGSLFSNYRSRDIPQRIVLYPSKYYSIMYTRLFDYLKVRILKSIITWSEMGQQTAYVKKGLLSSRNAKSPRSFVLLVSFLRVCFFISK